MSERSKNEIMEQIQQIITDNIQPSVEMHGGMIKLQDFDLQSGSVLVLLQGSCSGCSMSSATLKMGVENMLRHYVPEVSRVEGMDDPDYNDPYYS